MFKLERESRDSLNSSKENVINQTTDEHKTNHKLPDPTEQKQTYILLLDGKQVLIRNQEQTREYTCKGFGGGKRQ